MQMWEGEGRDRGRLEKMGREWSDVKRKKEGGREGGERSENEGVM